MTRRKSGILEDYRDQQRPAASVDQRHSRPVEDRIGYHRTKTGKIQSGADMQRQYTMVQPVTNPEVKFLWTTPAPIVGFS